MEPMFLGRWSTPGGVFEDFDVSAPNREGVNLLLAYYTYEDYSGSAFVLFESRGIFYEVNGAHCSCYGLEGQWDPEEVSVAELRHRLEKGNLGRYYSWENNKNKFAEELTALLDQIEMGAA